MDVLWRTYPRCGSGGSSPEADRFEIYICGPTPAHNMISKSGDLRVEGNYGRGSCTS